MNSGIINIGVIGCAQILKRSMINPCKELENVRLYGIASRDVIKATEFAKAYDIPNIFDSYEALLDCKDIDAVYIALPNHVHYKWIIKSIEAKKHILVEKPLCLNPKEAEMIEESLNGTGVHLLEGVMVQHHPWQKEVKRLIGQNQYGKLKSIKTKICIVSKQNNINKSKNNKGDGVFYDLSCYWLAFIQYVVGLDVNYYLGQSDFDGDNGCDDTFNGHVELKDGTRCDCICSYKLPYASSHELEFEYGKIYIKDFFRANVGHYKITLHLEDYNSKKKERIIFDGQNYYTNQLEFFLEVIEGKTHNREILKSYERIKVMDDLFRIAKEDIQR